MFLSLKLLLVLIQRTLGSYFSSKTAYDFVGNLDPSPIFPLSVKPVYINYLGRHGTRFPSANDVKKMTATFKRIKNGSHFYDYFPSGSFGYVASMDKDLAPRGVKELNQIGQRFRRRFQDLFDSECSNCKNFRFDSTCRTRAIQSMFSFAVGMFNISENTKWLPEIKTLPCENDYKYRYFDFCPLYMTKQKCLKKNSEEEKKLMKKNLFLKIAKKLAQGLGVQNNLCGEDIWTLYLLCAYNVSLNQASADEGVCSLFDEEAMRAMDYVLDVKNFYKRGGSDPLNILISCDLFASIYHSVANALRSCSNTCQANQSCEQGHGGDFGFAHAETLVPLLGNFELIGLSPDFGSNNPKTFVNAENFEELQNKRIYKGSELSPMGANFALVVGCTSTPTVEGVVLALLNEHPISLPCCQGEKLSGNNSIPICTSRQFMSCYEHRALSCNLEEICKGEYNCPKHK
ncbi:Multiple inositol polyphosphate phosphatase 1 [Thelohanellus kitauei]|uniref:Multiple inositol polyphosphate phosphatase 1 n=1 Tax=Thelohanellus kitauei TaxID=669202 RepID=A0A0C2I890_THEKT|nr:Multiple inositol polyphosphate phosphatase 1 [Thelohanellus kitauei]